MKDEKRRAPAGSSLCRGARLLYVLCLLVASAAGYCADWPQWHGLNRDGHSPETGLLKEWPAEGLKPLWVADGLGTGFSAVTVADGFVYATGMAGENNEGALSAFDLSGRRQWRTPYGPEWNDTYPGARSSPTVDTGRLYILSSMGRLVCFNAKTGAIEWSEDMAKKFDGVMPRCGFAESLLVDGNKVICTPGGKDAGLVALDKKTGQTLWTSRGFSDQSAYCSPILVERGGNRLIVTITARHVVGISPVSGAVVWSQPFDTEAEDPNHSVSPVYNDGCLYATSGHRKGGQMFEIAADGKQSNLKWEDTTLSNLHGGLVIVDGYLYGTNLKDKWVCLELKSGAVMYEAAGVGMGSVTYVDGMLYCYGEKGTLALVKASPKGFEIVSSFKETHGAGQHWAHPVISGGRLYIRHGDALVMYVIWSQK
ncbi:MAG: PQQ-like beta-propeller repeat protein [Candidatus Hydrogenedentes bacterium]|nr:PQQ-like beta-propeller repeat protein [Candidatus Hydrogenedentota bacterium]